MDLAKRKWKMKNNRITKVIDNYVIRYQSIMRFLYKEPVDVVNKRLGVEDYYTSIKKNKKYEFSANSLIKLLYFSAYSGVTGKNTMTMQMNIDGLPCTLTFQISDDAPGSKQPQDTNPGTNNESATLNN